MYDDLTPGRNDLDQNQALESSEIYVISRTWVTTFRDHAKKVINELIKKSPGESCGGIDLIDLRAVTASNESSSFFNGENPTSRISCERLLVLSLLCVSCQ